jgi:Flp pilus assembly protein protease CpaA
MSLFDWIVSLSALGWLSAVAVFDIRTRHVPNAYWTGVPILLAGAYRVLCGQSPLVAAAAAAVVLISERRHLEQKLLELLVLAAGIMVIAGIYFSVEPDAQMGVAGMVVFWLSWELRYIGGADAMVLITCLLIWPGIEFVLAYLAAGLVWTLGVRVKEGGWLKGHPVPGLAIVASAAAIFLAYRMYLQLID